MKEADLQKAIAEKLKDTSLFELIDKGSISSIMDEINKYNKNKETGYTINDVLKEKYLNSFVIVKKNITGVDLEVVCDTGKGNISMTENESLKPDILLYNAELNSYIILELKVNVTAERQAITELLGYQFEIKNHLPGMSNYNLPIIIVSCDYRPLLLHSIASLLLSGIPVMCLKPFISSNIKFEVMPFNIWTNLQLDKIEKEMFVGYTYCLYPMITDNPDTPNEKMTNKIITASELLCCEAALSGGQGISIAWRYNNANGLESKYYTTDYFVSVFYLNPYALCNSHYNDNDYKDIVSEHILKCCHDYDLKSFSCMGDSFFADKLKQYLNKDFSLNSEGYTDLSCFLNSIASEGRELILCDVWGDIGNVIKKNFINAQINMEYINYSIPAYKTPFNFLKLLCLSFGDHCFSNGFDIYSDYLRYGCETAYYKKAGKTSEYRYICYLVSKEIIEKKHKLSELQQDLLEIYEAGYSGYKYLCSNNDTTQLEASMFSKTTLKNLCNNYFTKYLECVTNHDENVICISANLIYHYHNTQNNDYSEENDEEHVWELANTISRDSLLELFNKMDENSRIDFYKYNIHYIIDCIHVR